MYKSTLTPSIWLTIDCDFNQIGLVADWNGIANKVCSSYINKLLIWFLFRNNPDHLFECFCEVGIAQDESALILQKYPSDYNQNEVLKCIPQFAYPCRFNVYVKFN